MGGSVGALMCWIGFAASIKFSSRDACALLRSAQPEISPPPGVVTAAISVYRGSPHASSRAIIASLRDVGQPVDSQVSAWLPIAAVVVSSVEVMYLRAAEATSGGTAGTSAFCTAAALFTARSTIGTFRLPSTRNPPWPSCPAH